MSLFVKLFGALIQAAHTSWRFKSPATDAGYTALVPVPADLPVFTKVALHTLFLQDSRHVTEALVIPDQPSAEYRQVFEGILAGLPKPPFEVKLVEMGWLDRWFGKISAGGNTYHFLQLINGIEHSRGAHVLFHDSDLFLPPGDVLSSRFEEYLARNITVFGVNPRQSVYNDECKHFVATWEMFASKNWLTRFRPYQMRGQYATVNGKTYDFDTTHLPQYLSSPDEIQHNVLNQAIVHFNYIITTYRYFNKTSRPFHDNDFKILFIRMLVDALDDSGWQYQLPTLEGCVAGLSVQDGVITYCDAEAAAKYPTFRQKLQELLELGLFDETVVGRLASGVAPFDEKFNWRLDKAA